MAKAKRNPTVHVFNPIGLDYYSPTNRKLIPGTEVHVAKPIEFGVYGKLGKQFKYVKDANTGEKYGMVQSSSLEKKRKK
jgi:hypothetical protein